MSEINAPGDYKLNEQELLLLSNYEYFACSANTGTIKENIDSLKDDNGNYDMEKVVRQGATGDIISEDDAVDILKRLENDEKLCSLNAARVINRGGIRATLYTDSEDCHPTLVFRGTGGTYRAWEDNVLGEYEPDTRLQSIAADFVKYECGAYDDITVTGHSKGGNLSQYVTIVCSDQIGRCVSFDGQGFGDNFINKYEDEISIASNKITSINGYNDFVNILLTPVAGTILYVKNQEGFSVDMHSCYTMMSEGVYDENGNFDRNAGVIPQMPLMSIVKRAGDRFVSLIDMLPKDGGKKVSDIAAALTAACFSRNETDEYEHDKIAGAISEFRAYTGDITGINEIINEKTKCGCDYLFINMYGVNKICEELDEITYKLGAIPDMIEEISMRTDVTVAYLSFSDKAFKKLITRTARLYESVREYTGLLREISNIYMRADM